MLKQLFSFLFIKTLHSAAQAGAIEKIQVFLDRGQGVNGLDKNGVTPLFWAAFAKNPEVAALLVKNGANVNFIGPHGTTPLYNALHKKNEPLALWLLDHGANAHSVTTQGIAPIHLAAMNNLGTVLSRLIALDADVNALTEQGQSPLCLAFSGLGRQPLESVSLTCVLRLMEAGSATDPVPGLPGDFSRHLGRLALPGRPLRKELEDFTVRTNNPILRKLAERALELENPRSAPLLFSAQDDAAPVLAPEPEVGKTLDSEHGQSLYGSTLHPVDDAALRAMHAAFAAPPKEWQADTPTDSWGRLKFKKIGRYQRVIELEITANGKVAPEIGDLVHLRKITTWCANLEGPLPETLGNLKNLQVLKLSGLPHLGERLPESIADLSALEDLELRDLPITALPDGLGRLKNLYSLSVWNCPLTRLPESLAGASALNQIWLRNCPVTTLPDGLGDLPQLAILMVSDCKLAKVPPFIGRMPSLRWLSLAGNSLGGAIPDFIFRPTLINLVLAENEFSGPVPESICNSPPDQSAPGQKQAQRPDSGLCG
ncbi:ankyrin repeat domain-containing protein [Desulfosarcina sp. OttesenSCG-928-G17]|nr:ankyrin repeat domain-containing protein [Desulfosarcina sp. OttesenSCG-928-G17]